MIWVPTIIGISKNTWGLNFTGQGEREPEEHKLILGCLHIGCFGKVKKHNNVFAITWVCVFAKYLLNYWTYFNETRRTLSKEEALQLIKYESQHNLRWLPQPAESWKHKNSYNSVVFTATELKVHNSWKSSSTHRLSFNFSQNHMRCIKLFKRIKTCLFFLIF